MSVSEKIIVPGTNVLRRAGNTLISVDRDGTGNTYNSTDLIVLKNTDITLDELLNNNQLLF